MKQLFKDFMRGVVCGFGTFVGIGLYGELRDKESRAEIKKKIIRIKDIIFKKGEES